MTLDELDDVLPNGFHDAKMLSLELDYVAAVAKFSLLLLVGRPEDPEAERDAYQGAILTVTGLCVCAIDPPDSTYPFIPKGKPVGASGDPAKPDHLASLPELAAKFPAATWCYRFFVDDWNAFIHIAGSDALLTWIGEKPKHAS